MVKIQEISIVTSFIGLWAHPYLPDQYEIFFGFLLIFTFGLLHGANDLLIIHKFTAANKKVWFGKLTGYVASVLGVGIFFYLFPTIGLIGFLIYSAYHFGEQQWQNLEKSSLFKLFEFTYGLFILMLLFIFHIKEVQVVIQNITSVVIPENYFIIGLGINIVLLVTLGIYFYRKLIDFKNRILLEAFYLLVFTVIFRVSSLIWGFAIYFIIWHSIPSIINQINYLNGEINWKNFGKYIKSAFVYWIISLIGIAILYFLFKDIKIFNALFFSFLAAITFPHVLVIFILFKKK